MNPLATLDQEALLDMLTKYYNNYREVLESNWNQKDYTIYRDSLEAIITELNRRTESPLADDLPMGPKHQRGNLNEPRR